MFKHYELSGHLIVGTFAVLGMDLIFLGKVTEKAS